MFNGNQRVSRETIFVFFLLLSFLFGNQARPTFSKQLAAKDYQMAKVLVSYEFCAILNRLKPKYKCISNAILIYGNSLSA